MQSKRPAVNHTVVAMHAQISNFKYVSIKSHPGFCRIVQYQCSYSGLLWPEGWFMKVIILFLKIGLNKSELGYHGNISFQSNLVLVMLVFRFSFKFNQCYNQSARLKSCVFSWIPTWRFLFTDALWTRVNLQHIKNVLHFDMGCT